MAIFDLAAGLGDEAHGLVAIFRRLVERSAFVITFLVRNGILVFLGADDIVLQLTHGLHFNTCRSFQGLVGFVEDVLRRAFVRLSVTAVV